VAAPRAGVRTPDPAAAGAMAAGSFRLRPPMSPPAMTRPTFGCIVMVVSVLAAPFAATSDSPEKLTDRPD
jgi:hypothetical protein